MAARKSPSRSKSGSRRSKRSMKAPQRGSAASSQPAGRKAASSSSAQKAASASQSAGVRLQKALAAAGIDSRRKCEELILAGRVEVDGQVVTRLGTRVDPLRQQIRVDGEPLPRQRLFYYAVHKPPGVVCTNYDRAGRPRVVDLVPSRGARLFTVGRLDLNSEGLILVTNDGELTERVTHPRYGVPKQYRVLVAGLAEGVVRAEKIRVRSHHKQSTVLDMVLCEGRNREIRRMFARVGHKVMKLARVAVGPIRLGRLAPGDYRELTRREVEALRTAAGLAPGRDEPTSGTRSAKAHNRSEITGRGR